MQACLVLPTFNEAPNLEALLAAVRKAVPALGILVVDDRSPDGTGVLAEQLAARDRRWLCPREVGRASALSHLRLLASDDRRRPTTTPKA